MTRPWILFNSAYYKASRMLHHHTHLTYPIRDQKTNTVFDKSMASPDSITLLWGCVIDASSLLFPSLGVPTEFGRPAEFGRSLWVPSEFGRSRRVWALPPSLGAPARRRRNPLFDGHGRMTCVKLMVTVGWRVLNCSIPSLLHSPLFRLWGVRRHHTGWRLVGRTLRFTLQTV